MNRLRRENLYGPTFNWLDSPRPSREEIPPPVMEAGVLEGGGATLSDIYKTCQKMLMRTKDGLGRLEGIHFSSSSSDGFVDPLQFATSVRGDINQIQMLCSDMDRLWRSIPSQGQRGLWKRKVEQMMEEVDSLRKSLDKQVMRHQKRLQEDKEKQDLLNRANGESDHVLKIFDDEAQAMEHARNSSKMLDEAYETAVAILHKYADQRDILKRAQRKALDAINTLGLSGTVLKLIERRHRTDKWIAYGGMILVIVVVIAFWRWIH